MSGLRSSRNLSAPPTLIRAGNLARQVHFLGLGVKPDPMVPHTWGLGHPQQFPRGGVVVAIYIRINLNKLDTNGFRDSPIYEFSSGCGMPQSAIPH